MKDVFLKVISCLLWVFLFSKTEVYGQLTVTPNLTPTQLASVIAGQGVTISNAVFTGSVNAEGRFTATGTNLGLTNGILLSTGRVADAIGPNDVNNSGVDLHQPGDIDLESLTGIQTFDATVLEFDFIPQSDSISFRYVFASEEYPEYVCTDFNDIFGFFISGPGIAGTPNIALIPGTTSPVAINTVNNGSIGDSVVGPPSANCGLGYTLYYTDNTGGTSIQFDGFTTVLEAKYYVTRCLTYHLKIAIADGTDGIYDSGVFLEAGSLFSTPIVTAGNDVNNCSNANLTIGGNASNGWTYSWWPTTGLSNPLISNPLLTLTNSSNTPLAINYVVTATDGSCILKDTVLITLNPIPNSPFIISTPEICVGQALAISYTGSTPSTASYFWNAPGATLISGSGQGPYSINYADSGDFSISLSVSQFGCTSPTTSIKVRVNQIPVSSFTMPPVVCQGDNVPITFTGTAGLSAQYTWLFGNTNTLSGSGSGPYVVNANSSGNTFIQLIIDESGCKDTSINLLSVKPKPQASISMPLSFCTSDTVSVLFNGIAGTSSIYTWDFGNAIPLSGSGSGPYQLMWMNQMKDSIQLILTDNGCRDTTISKINSYQQPIASVLFDSTLCASDTCHISFTGTAAATSVYNWKFNNGTIINGSGNGPYDVLWNTPGRKFLQLNIMNSGCVDSLYDSLMVFSKPIITVSASSVCEGFPTQFKSTSAVPDGKINYLEWKFGDNFTAINDSQPQHNYTKYGNYQVVLIANSENGCRDSITFPYQVYEKPVANFLTDSVCVGKLITFFDRSTITSSPLNTWKWFTGNGDSLTKAPFTYSYPQSGQYSASLIVTSMQGCADTAQHFIRVWSLPKASFTPLPANGCQPLIVTFQNNSTSTDGLIAKWKWDLGDSSADSLITPHHTYREAGTFNVSLQVTSETGCVHDTMLLQCVTVYPKPDAEFSYTPHIPDLFFPNVSFTNESVNAFKNVWNFGDGKSSTEINPQHTFINSGSFHVTLYVTSNEGCKDTIAKNIELKNIFSVYIPNAFTPNADTRNDAFEIKGYGILEYSLIIFDRWGKMIFKSEDLTDSWDGTFNNKPAPEDTYVYLIKVLDILNKNHDYKGRISLIR